MQRRFSSRILLALAMFIVATAAVIAADRTIWKHSGGTFSKGKGDNWIERGNAADAKTFLFKETARTDEYVEIQRLKSDLKVRLKNKVCLVQDQAGMPFRKLYDGEWVDKP